MAISAQFATHADQAETDRAAAVAAIDAALKCAVVTEASGGDPSEQLAEATAAAESVGIDSEWLADRARHFESRHGSYLAAQRQTEAHAAIRESADRVEVARAKMKTAIEKAREKFRGVLQAEEIAESDARAVMTAAQQARETLRRGYDFDDELRQLATRRNWLSTRIRELEYALQQNIGYRDSLTSERTEALARAAESTDRIFAESEAAAVDDELTPQIDEAVTIIGGQEAELEKLHAEFDANRSRCDEINRMSLLPWLDFID